MSNRPRTRVNSGDSCSTASAAAHSRYAAQPPTTPAPMIISAAARLNGATRAMFRLTRWYSQA